MTQPPNNPPPDPAPPPGQALKATRIVIALGLIAAVGVFGVLAIRELAKPRPTTPTPRDFGASDAPPGRGDDGQRLPGDTEREQTNPLLALAQGGVGVPIDHHPGRFEPFQGAASFIQPPYRQKNTDTEVWEFCSYRVQDASPKAAFAHYAAQAEARGMKLMYNKPSDTRGPGGLIAAWSDGKKRLELTAWPTQTDRPLPPPPPPLRPVTPLDWVVKYSYPLPTDARTPR